MAFQGKHTIADPGNQVLVILTYTTNSCPFTLLTSFSVRDAIKERIRMVLGMWFGPVISDALRFGACGGVRFGASGGVRFGAGGGVRFGASGGVRFGAFDGVRFGACDGVRFGASDVVGDIDWVRVGANDGTGHPWLI